MFYENVKKLCALHNTNITNLAKELGMSTSMPTSWKNGVVPRATTLRKIADYFGVTVESLFYGGGVSLNTAVDVVDSFLAQGNTGTTIINGQKEKLSDMESELLRIFRSLDMRTKNKVMSYMYDIEDQAKEVNG